MSARLERYNSIFFRARKTVPAPGALTLILLHRSNGDYQLIIWIVVIKHPGLQLLQRESLEKRGRHKHVAMRFDANMRISKDFAEHPPRRLVGERPVPRTTPLIVIDLRDAGHRGQEDAAWF